MVMRRAVSLLSVVAIGVVARAAEPPRPYGVVRSGTVPSQRGYLAGVEVPNAEFLDDPPIANVTELGELMERSCERPVDPPLRASGRGPVAYSSRGTMVNLRGAADSSVAAPGDLTLHRVSSPQAVLTGTPLCTINGTPSFQAGTSFTCEPTVTSVGDVQFMTGNWFAALSDDGGFNWRFIDPFDNFNADGVCDVPANAGNFCCDQVALHDPSRDQTFWFIQYTRDGSGNNVQTLAVARTLNDLMNNTWTLYDFAATTFGFNGAFWLDFPDLTVSDDFLWITTRVFNNATPAASQAEVLMRIGLDDLKDGGGIGFQFANYAAGSPVRCVRGAGDTAFCGQQQLLDEIRIHRWFEDSNEVAFDDVDHPDLTGGNFLCTGPGGRNYCQGADNRLLGAYRSNGELGFLRASAQNENFPYPYVDVIKVRESDRGYLTTEPMWSNQFALTYPSVHPNSGGGKGGVVAIGGGAEHPVPCVFIVDGYNNHTFAGTELVPAGTGTATPPAGNRWGDYFSTQLHWLDDRTYLSSGHYLNGPNAANVVPVSVWFGREADQPPGDFDLRSAFAVAASSYLHGESLDAGASVTNVGVGPVSVPLLEFRLSTDNNVTVGDTLLGATSVNLNGGAVGEAHVVKAIPEVASGDYFVGAFPLLYSDAFNGNHYAVSAGTVRICPNVAEHPATINVPACGTAAFHAASTGPDDMNFRWQYGLFDFEYLVDDIRTRGTSTDTMTIDRVFPFDGQVTYRALISNALCSPVATFAAGLHVIPPTASPIFGGGPHTVCQDATFDAVSNGIPAFMYQWRQNNVALADDDHRTGSQAEDLAFDGLLYSDNGQYTVRIANDCDSSTSNPVGLSVAYKPWTTAATTGPSYRYGPSMAYDSRRGVTVLFGGLYPDYSSFNRETWEWNGNTWTLRATNGPTARRDAGMAYDSDRGTCVLFGGLGVGSQSPYGFLDDTWEWDGNSWTQRVTTGPARRVGHGMVYDSTAKKTVLFSGFIDPPGGPFYAHDTWEFDGVAGTWIQISSGLPDLPPGGYVDVGAIAYDIARNKRFAFNGWLAPDFNWDMHTFEWDGAQWVRIFPANDPVYRNPGMYTGGAGIAYHQGRQTVIWNNGAYRLSDPIQVTWSFDGAAWKLLSHSDGPPRSAGGAIAYDSARNAIVQFGGGGPSGFVPGDTWELVDADRVEIVRQAKHRAVVSGQPVQFSVTAKGAPTHTYQWRRNGNNLNNGAVISGANTSVLRIGTATLAHPGEYDVVVTNDCGSVTSAVANLTVIITRFGDGDIDDDVDLVDADLLAGCTTGPDVERSPGCEPFDFDGDGDVDMLDVAEFQKSFDP